MPLKEVFWVVIYHPSEKSYFSQIKYSKIGEMIIERLNVCNTVYRDKLLLLEFAALVRDFDPPYYI